MIHKNIRPSYRRIGLSQEFVIAPIDDPFPPRIFPLTTALSHQWRGRNGERNRNIFDHFPQLIFSPSFADSNMAKLFKGIDKIWEIVHCSSDQSEAEREVFSFLVRFPVIHGRFKDERVRSCGIFSHYLSISRNRCFKDIGIYTLMSQKTISAFLALKGTDNAPKCMAESAAESGTAVRWKKKRGFGCDRKDIFRKVESFQAAAPYIKG